MKYTLQRTHNFIDIKQQFIDVARFISKGDAIACAFHLFETMRIPHQVINKRTGKIIQGYYFNHNMESE